MERGIRQAHPEGEQQQRDADVAEHADGGQQRRPQGDAGEARRQAGQGGQHHRQAPQVGKPGAVVQHPGAEREVQQVLHQEQHHRRRQRRLAEGQHRQGQAHVAGVVEHHRRQEGLRIDLQQARQRPGQGARTEDHRDAADGQRLVGHQVEGFSGQRGEHQRRHEDIHVELVGERHVGLVAPPVEPARRDDGEQREDNRDDAQKHRQST